MPNKKVINSFSIFLEEVRAEYARKGVNYGSLADVIPHAKPRWNLLTAEQKKEYDRKAKSIKAEKKKTLDGKYDSFQVPLKLKAKQEREAQEAVENMYKDITNQIQSLSFPSEVARKKFYLITFKTFCSIEDGDVIPAEIALLEFSIKDGVSKTYHAFFDPTGYIPTGYGAECRKAEEEHGIPYCNFDKAERDYTKIFGDVLRFIKSKESCVGAAKAAADEYCPVYCIADEIPRNERIFNLIGEITGVPDNGQIRLYDFGQLATTLQNEVARNNDEPLLPPSIVVSWFSSMVYKFSSNMACSHHDELDMTMRCALAEAKNRAYVLLSRLTKPCGVASVPGKHAPVEDVPFYVSGTKCDDDDDDGGASVGGWSVAGKQSAASRINESTARSYASSSRCSELDY